MKSGISPAIEVAGRDLGGGGNGGWEMVPVADDRKRVAKYGWAALTMGLC